MPSIPAIQSAASPRWSHWAKNRNLEEVTVGPETEGAEVWRAGITADSKAARHTLGMAANPAMVRRVLVLGIPVTVVIYLVQ